MFRLMFKCFWNRFIEIMEVPQQTFALMKTSWRHLSFRLQKTSSRRLDQDEYVRLSLMSSEDVFKTSSRRLGQDQYILLGYTHSRRLQDVFEMSSRRLAKASSRRFEDVFKTSSRHLQNVFKTSSRHLAKISSRRFQGLSSSQTVLVNTSSRSI